MKTQRITPLGNHVAVEPLEAEKESPGGIILPDMAKEKPQIGVVVAVGPGEQDDPEKPGFMPLKPGDKVLYGRYSSNDVEVNGRKLKILTLNDIYAILE